MSPLLQRLRSDTRPVLALLALVVTGLVTFLAALGVLGGTPEAAAGSEATWSRELPKAGRGNEPVAPPAVVTRDGVVVAAGSDGVAALDAMTGELRWTRDLPVAIHGFGRDAAMTPLGDDLVTVALERRRDDDPTVAILDVADGATVWELMGGVSMLESAAGTVVVSGSSRGRPSVAAYDAADGERLWTHDLPAAEEFWSANVAVTTDTVFVAFDAVRFDPETGQEEAGEQFVVALDLRSGEVRWRVEPGLRPFSLDGAEQDDPLVVVGRQDERNALVALDPTTGEERWRWTPDDGTPFSVLVDDGRVAAVLDVSGGSHSFDEPPYALVVLDREGREVLRDEPRFDPHFWFAGDRLVVASSHGHPAQFSDEVTLTVIDLTTGDPLWERGYATPTAWGSLGVAPTGDSLVVSEPNGSIHAVDLDTGETAWTSAPFGADAGDRDPGPATTGDAVYLLGADGALRSYISADGEERWSRLHSIVGSSPPAVDERRVYAATGLGVVRAYDRHTGEVMWETERRHDALEQGAPRPAVAAGTVVVADPDGTLLALDTATGEQRWAAPAEEVLAVTGQGSRIVVAYRDGLLVSLDARSGDEAWQREMGDLRWGPFPAGNALLVATTQGRVIAVDAASGEPRWDFDAGGAVLPPPARDATSVYVLTDRVTALDLSDGSVRWEALPGEGASFVGHPAVTRGQVFVTATDLTVRVLSAATGSEVDLVDVAVPIAGISATPDGLLLVETSEGELRAYR